MSEIVAAENSYRQLELAIAAAREKKGKTRARRSIVGLVLFAVSTATGVIMNIAGAEGIPLIVANVLLIAGLFMFIWSTQPYATRQSLPGYWEEEKQLDDSFEQLEKAQRTWVESHGLKLPKGSFEELNFPALPDREAGEIYGTAQLLDAEEDKLISVVLKMDPSKGYVLHGADGQLLQELTH